MLAIIGRRSAPILLVYLLLAPSFVTDLKAQDSLVSDSQRLEHFLGAGEFSLALELANQQIEPANRDSFLRQIAEAQRFGASGLAAFDTLARISDDSTRYQGFADLTDYSGAGFGRAGRAGEPGGRNGVGGSGGITEADFTELMDLLQETIDPDSWEENGGNGRISPFPSGVFVDSQGTLKRIEKDKTGRLDKLRERFDRGLEDDSLTKETELRKISLGRLERELQRRAALGQKVSEDLKYLAGIYQLKYVMLYPESGDVVIAGPAGPWHYDNRGRAINTASGMPVLNLDDLVVCLRNARSNLGQFSCSIDPRSQNLADSKQFVDSTTLKGKAFRTALQAKLGKMDVTVDGIDPASHASRVIVEADYRMKLIGLGVEDSVSQLKSYFERIDLDENGKLTAVDQLVRWWFTMNYDSVQTNADRTVFELNGAGVKLLSESEFWNERGERVHTGQSSPPAKGFAQDFTRLFPEIASSDPVFAELKNVFDCAMVASLIYQEGLNRQVKWKLAFLDGNDRPGVLSWQLQAEPVPTQVESIIGQRVLRHREGRRSLTHTITAFGGGVICNSSQHTSKDSIKVTKSKPMTTSYEESVPPSDNVQDWTWD